MNPCSNCGKPCGTAESVCAQCDEAAGIAAQMIDSGRFLELCHAEPDEALRRISKLLNVVPAMGDNCALLIFRFLALGRKAYLAYEKAGGTLNKQGLRAFEECLCEYRRARDAEKSKEEEAVFSQLTPHLNCVVEVLEQYAPGRATALLKGGRK